MDEVLDLVKKLKDLGVDVTANFEITIVVGQEESKGDMYKQPTFLKKIEIERALNTLPKSDP